VNANSFEFQLSVPRDEQVAVIIRMLAEQAARYAGCSEHGAVAFGAQVEEAVRVQLNGAQPHGSIPVVVRRMTGPLEVLVDTRTVALEL
jgi:hypothetical protein